MCIAVHIHTIFAFYTITVGSRNFFLPCAFYFSVAAYRFPDVKKYFAYTESTFTLHVSALIFQIFIYMYINIYPTCFEFNDYLILV